MECNPGNNIPRIRFATFALGLIRLRILNGIKFPHSFNLVASNGTSNLGRIANHIGILRAMA